MAHALTRLDASAALPGTPAPSGATVGAVICNGFRSFDLR
jgi:hypothetical protein